jgi:hypothetical protein
MDRFITFFNKRVFLSVILACFFNGFVFTQYQLTDAQITKGFLFLKEKGGFRNPNSVQYVGHMKSKHAYTRSCFSWSHYTVNAQNGFGGYARGNYIVFFLDGQPILKMSDDHPYYSQPNSDYVADQVIALSRAFGSYAGDECPGDAKAREQKENKYAEDIKSRDKQTRISIAAALDQKDYFTALQLHDQLSNPDAELLSKINAGWVIDEDRLNKVYEEYLRNFEKLKKEYYADPKEFIAKYEKGIKIKTISINGSEVYNELLNRTSDQESKMILATKINKWAFAYYKTNDRHLVCPIGVFSNAWGRLQQKELDQVNISLVFDTILNNYKPVLEFQKDGDMKHEGVILNSNTYETKYFLVPFPEEIKNIYTKILSDFGEVILESLYPQKKLNLNTKESISLKNLSSVKEPEAGMKNDKYESLKNDFGASRKEVFGLYKREPEMSFKNLYNPSLLHLVRTIYSDADSMVLILGKRSETDLGDLGIHFKAYDNRQDEGKDYNLSLIPLIKGKVGLSGGKLIIAQRSGDYMERQVNVVEGSKIDLKSINIEELRLDSIFFGTYDGKINFYQQYPFAYKQLILDNTDNPYEFIFNEEVVIPMVRVLNTSWTEAKKAHRLHVGNRMPWMGYIKFIFYRFNDSYGAAGEHFGPQVVPLEKYLKEMTSYLRFKQSGDSKKAFKSLAKANKYAETLRQIYRSSQN